MAITIRKTSKEAYRLASGKDTQFFATALKSSVPTIKEKLRVTMADGSQFLGTIFSVHSSGAVGVRLASGKEYNHISCEDNIVEVISAE